MVSTVEQTASNAPPHSSVNREALRQAILSHIEAIGLSGISPDADISKQNIRDIQAYQRQVSHGRIRRALGTARIERMAQEHLADGSDIDPRKIRPRIELVDSTKESGRIFRFATLFWSVPVSLGYGRRMRFLVWDSHNDKLIGAFALCDPVFNLKRRDEWIGWNRADRRERLVHTMRAYVTGSLPPYSYLLGGKLGTSLVASSEVGQRFQDRYADTTGIISGQRKRAQLTLVTFTSALGRSSIYNRLRLYNGELEPAIRLDRLGYTEGFGHFQIPDDQFEQVKNLLDEIDHPYRSPRLGTGPNWRIRVVRIGLQQLDLDEDSVLKHGIRREIFVMPIADNAKAFLSGADNTPHFENQHAVDEISRLARDRWMVPRARRRPEYRDISRQSIIDDLQL